jgi:hypothetical protein
MMLGYEEAPGLRSGDAFIPLYSRSALSRPCIFLDLALAARAGHNPAEARRRQSIMASGFQ